MRMTMRAMRRRTGPVALAAVWLLIASGVANGQPAVTDTLNYQLVSAEVSTTPPRVGFIVVEFGGSMPSRYLTAANQTLTPALEWRLQLRDLRNPATVTTVEVKAVFVPDAPAQNRLVVLQPATPVDPATHQIKVLLLEGNFPEVIVNRPKKVSSFGPAKGNYESADIYFKGLVLATSDTKPAYSIDAKAAYYRKLGAKGGGLGAKATYLVDKASDIGPDSITASVAYSKVFVFAPATGLVLAADAFGFELDAKNETRNIRSAATGQFVFPSLELTPKSFVTADAVVGYEAGHNSTNAVTANSLGSLWRTVVGGSGYLVLKGAPVFPRIDVTASWRVRLLAQDEPFTERRNGVNVTELTDSARHLVNVTGAFMVTDALGLSLTYRHGSEPPAYKYFKHRAEFGVVFKLTQVNKS